MTDVCVIRADCSVFPLARFFMPAARDDRLRRQLGCLQRKYLADVSHFLVATFFVYTAFDAVSFAFACLRLPDVDSRSHDEQEVPPQGISI